MDYMINEDFACPICGSTDNKAIAFWDVKDGKEVCTSVIWCSCGKVVVNDPANEVKDQAVYDFAKGR